MKHFLYLFTWLTTIVAASAQTPSTLKSEARLNGHLRSLSDAYKQNKRLDSSIVNSRLINFDKSSGRVLVNAIAERDTATLSAELRQVDAEIVSSRAQIVSAWVPVANLSALESLTSCRSVRPAYRPRLRTGPVNSQGDSAQRSGVARRQFGVIGQGVKVGVLSDSYAALPQSNTGVTTGELPGIGNPNGYTTAVTNVLDYTTSGASDEGRAMLEIIHDVAPGAQLFFRTAFISNTDFAAGIQQLANLGCKVIIDDIGYFEEPFFQDGVIAQSVDNVKNNNGVTYFSAAGNSGNASYEANYQPSTYRPFSGTINPEVAHNFGTAAAPVYFLPIRLPALGEAVISFQWDDPFFSVTGNRQADAQTDLDIYLLNAIPSSNTATVALSSIVARGSDDNLASGDPVEILSYANPSNTPRTFYIMIVKYAGPNPTRIKYVENYDSTFPAAASAIVGINASTCYGHPNAAGAIATGAAFFLETPAYGINPPLIEDFSSKGGTPIYFTPNGTRLPSPVTRQKPDVTAPDGANTSFFFRDSASDPDTSPNFFGTSAAAPHAGAVAALMLQANPTLTPSAVLTALTASCLDMDDPTTPGFSTGFDFVTGHGLIRADVAVQNAIPASLPCVSLTSGNWNSAATWSCGFIPQLTNPVSIGNGHIVTISGQTARAQKVTFSGTGKLNFLNNGKLGY
ncbi:S8 family peptidase [Rudanella lutea]|uniref:S8 family peptidase n=1 Tax=Rudanella lutea TaxID=451374 RepID=UPI0003A86CD1|nr:S8 family serine peptidase [Rudanella lutea]